MSDAKVAIADDHPLFRAALKQAVVECFPKTSILEAENFQDLMNQIPELCSPLILVT